MGKQINFTYKGQDFTLEFNKKTVKELEQSGVTLNAIQDGLFMNTLPQLFKGAFRMHHRKLDDKYIDEIFANFTKRKDLWDRLTEMYLEPVNELMDGEPDEDSENLIEWETTEG